MTNGLNIQTAKWLTYLVYFLLTLTSIGLLFMAFLFNGMKDRVTSVQKQIRDFPEDYIQKERYSCDIGRIETLLRDLNLKLDRVTERNREMD